jgi:hypothetical protein
MDEKRIQSKYFISEMIFFEIQILELLKEAERVGSKTPKEKIDIYHETAEACRSVGNGL